MRILILLLFTLIFNVCLYAQDTNAQNTNNNVNNTAANNVGESAIMQVNKFDAKKNPISFINLVNFTPYYVLQEYARVNNIEIYPYDTESTLRARIIERQVNIKQEVITDKDQIKEVARNTINTGGAQVELIGADFVERYEIKEAEEELISLYGNVTMRMYNNTLIADRVVYSLKTGEVFAAGNLRVESGETTLHGEWFMLNRENKKGVLFGGGTKFMSFTVEGRIIKFNDQDFFAENSSVSFSRLTPVAHDFLTSRVYLWDDKKMMVFNSIYRVGRQPVFYFPLFLQNYMGTGIISSFGESLREGVYIQNYKIFNLYGVQHKIRFDAYQKLGFLIGDEIRYTSQYQDLSLDAMFALGRQYYLLDSYITSSIGYGTRYVNYFASGEGGKFVPRYKFQYDHTIQLYSSQNINSYITGKLNLNSDLYFKSDFYNQRGQFDILTFFTSVTGNLQDIGDSYPEYYTENSVYVNNNIYGVNLKVGAEWDLQAVRNISVDVNTNFDYYMPKPYKLILPSVEASYSSVFGDETSYYFPGLNLDYSLRANYNHTIDYKTSEGIAFYNNPMLDEQLNDKLAERNNLNLYGSLSRNFTNDFIRFVPSVNMEYSYQNSIDATAEDLIYDKDNTYLGLGTGMNFSIFLPYSILPYNFTHYFEPTVRWDTTYTLNYRFKEKYIDTDAIGSQVGEFNNHNFTTKFTLGGTGYSLFFIPDLNLNLESSIRTGYDFIPTYNSETRTYQVEFSTNKMLTTEVGASARLLYNQSYISYDISRNLLGTNLTVNRINSYFHFPIPLGKITDWILIKNNKKPFFDGIINDFNLYFGFSFTHDFINYRYNTAAFTFGIELQVLDQWRFRIATTSANEKAYRYIKSYAEKENETWVNPFWDIVNSFNFSDSQKRTDSLFKLKSIEASIWHELDGWQILATFAVRPSTLPSDITSGSVKGIYWDKEFWIEFTLTDFPNVGLPRKEYNLNSTITDLQDSAATQ
ncbi:LPS-assembly protein LptD [Brachyspira sp. G79]|uniref:LPS-assembly protein LptD n=1 Tax=Brachyspira sp. G79 TaxID=1358104 RepID=UPI000BBC4070|nr:LPS-assembly protein LptD [Brachyspira sp. G79]PCG19558.1 cell envelope biogenesis protein [Brachyspira sp. G79]